MKNTTTFSNEDIINSIATVNAKLDTVNSRLSKSIQDVNTKLSQEIKDVNITLSEAIQGLATNMDQRFKLVDIRFEQVDDKFLDITTTLDYLTTTTLRTHDDHLAAIEWLKRHERRLDRHELGIRSLRHST